MELPYGRCARSAKSEEGRNGSDLCFKFLEEKLIAKNTFISFLLLIHYIITFQILFLNIMCFIYNEIYFLCPTYKK